MADILLEGAYIFAVHWAVWQPPSSSALLRRVSRRVLRGQFARPLFTTARSTFPWKSIIFSTSSLINRTTNDITQIQTLVAMGLQAIIKSTDPGRLGHHQDCRQGLALDTCYSCSRCGADCHADFDTDLRCPAFPENPGPDRPPEPDHTQQLTGIRVVRAYNAEAFQEKNSRTRILTSPGTILRRTASCHYVAGNDLY